MEFKGTQGKWFACCLKNRPHYVFSSDGETTICRPYQVQEGCDDLTDEEFRANALLISKAPEMLEMLIKFTSTMDLVNNIEQAKKLIKEATEL